MTAQGSATTLVQFVHRLRNYTLHSRLPIAQGQLRGTSESFESRVVLPRDELRRWPDWNAGARRYLDATPEDIGLLDVIDEYIRVVRGFNEWSGAELVRGHLQAFEELARLQQKLLAAQTFG